MHEKKHFDWRRVRRTALALVGAVLLFQVGFLLYFRTFYSAAEKSFAVPGLSGAFVPQGMENCDGGFLLSGYLSASGAARLYWVADSGAARSLRVLDENGLPLISHAGGVAADESFVYLVGGGFCYVFSAEEVRSPAQREVTALGSFRTYNRASFCSLWNGELLVGEYASGTRYRTDDTHHLTTPAGDENPALVLAFPLDAAEPLGVRSVPEEAWSIPAQVQGMSVSGDGRVVLSTSGVLGGSQLYLHDLTAVLSGRTGIFWAADAPVPLRYVDSTSYRQTLHLPPQAEETTFRDGQLYVLFESAARRFQYGKLVGGQYVYRFPLE